MLTRMYGIGKRKVDVLFIPMPGGWYARYLESGGFHPDSPLGGTPLAVSGSNLPPAPSLPPA